MDELYEKYLYGCLFLQNKLMIYVNNNNAYSAVTPTEKKNETKPI
jgi:hypothetical protein